MAGHWADIHCAWEGGGRSGRDGWRPGATEGLQKVGPGRENDEAGDGGEVVEVVMPRAVLFPCGPPEVVGDVADAVLGGGEQVQGDGEGCEVWLTVAEIVFQVIAVGFENVEGFVFDFPAGAAEGNSFDDIVGTDWKIGDETVAIGDLAVTIADFDFEPVDV